MKRYAILVYNGIPKMCEAPDGKFVKYEDVVGAETLRDEFAMHAMASYIIANPEASDPRIAGLAYGTADAMLEARNANR